MPSRKTEVSIIEVDVPDWRDIQVAIIGTSPYVSHAKSFSTLQDLLFPARRRTAAERAQRLKHDPLWEFRHSVHALGPGSPTAIAVTATAIKSAISTAALDVPGTTKSKIERLVWVSGERLPIYGDIYLRMDVVRQSGMTRAPDVRARACLPRWAVPVTIGFASPLINLTAVINLLHMAGRTVGIGDLRPEQGKGNCGQFRVVDLNDPEYLEIVQASNYDTQRRQLMAGIPYDENTRHLLDWSYDEAQRRGVKITTPQDDDARWPIAA